MTQVDTDVPKNPVYLRVLSKSILFEYLFWLYKYYQEAFSGKRNHFAIIHKTGRSVSYLETIFVLHVAGLDVKQLFHIKLVILQIFCIL